MGLREYEIDKETTTRRTFGKIEIILLNDGRVKLVDSSGFIAIVPKASILTSVREHCKLRNISSTDIENYVNRL